jgi:uncharacterized surface protein with fasciclin (FAS1) repeats
MLLKTITKELNNRLYMIRIKPLLWTTLLVLIFLSCRDNFIDDIYKRPDWLAGKVYSQILEQPELSTFAKAIELVGYDTIVDISGTYTVFGPTNDAFNAYFASNPDYNSIDQMPVEELSRLVKYHIIQYPWTKIQLRSLDVYGWIDSLDLTNNEPRGYKHETLLRDKNIKYGLEAGGTIIVDTLSSDWHRKVASDSRKFAPVFYQEYFDIYDLKSNDFEFYFGRSFESTEIYYANAKITSDEISAENGFVYLIDEVVEPLKSAFQFLAQDKDNRYTRYLNLVNLYPEFEYNKKKTLEQPGAKEGLVVDSLFDLTYPELIFDINNEKTSVPAGTYDLPAHVTIRYHNGLLAPTNDAMAQFETDFFQIPNGWGSIDGAPVHIKKIIANTYMSFNSIYQTDIEEGFYNGESDIIHIDESSIIQKEYGSNSTFLGLNKAVEPRAFSSVTGPVYLQQGYSKVMYAIEHSGLLPSLKRPGKDYMLFVENDNKSSADSSLLYDPSKKQFRAYSELGPGGNPETHTLEIEDLRTLILNHIAIHQPKGSARKEFIPNLAGNYIIVNNETGEYSGTGITTSGYRGTDYAPEFPSPLAFESDNGQTYDIDNWFSFTGSSLYGKISTEYAKFHSLLNKAGLAREKEYRYTFISNSELYTVFVPSDAALESAQLDTLSTAELKKLLMLHFIQGDLIFTDGNKNPGYYKSKRVDEQSTQYSTVTSGIYIEPGIDIIRIHDKNGNAFAEVQESEECNKLTAINLGEGSEVFPIMVNNAVIHRIDKVLQIEELDRN